MTSDGADGRHTPIAWLKSVRHSGEYSDVIVRVAHEEFKLHLLLLLSDSTYFHQQVDANPASNQVSKLVVDLIDFPGGPEIFHVVVDHWYGSMEHEISTSNVAKVLAASDFLGVESLQNRSLKFLDENVFNCWESSLRLLATLDCKEDPPVEDKLFDRCVDAFLDQIKTKNPLNSAEISDCPIFCNVTHLVTVMTLLPANMDKLIYDRILGENPGLFYGVEDTTEPSATVLLVPTQRVEFKSLLKSEFDERWISWVERLPELLPDLHKRAILLAGLCYLMMQGEDPQLFSMSFLCSLLVQMVEASEAMASKDMPINDWDTIMEDTEFYVGLNMDVVRPDVLLRCKFTTVVAMVKHFKSWSEEYCGVELEGHVDQNAKALNACLVAHLNRGSLSVAQVLSIYQLYPNDARSNHIDLYNAFKDVLVMKTASVEQQHEISQILDFEKLPDACVWRMFQGLEVDHEPRLLKRVLEIQEESIKHFQNNVTPSALRVCGSYTEASLVLVKHFKVFMTAAAEREEGNAEVHAAKLALELQVRQQADELASLNEEKSRQERELQVKVEELITMREEKRRLESEIGNQTAELDTVSEEKMKLEIVLEHQTAELIGESINNNLLRRELNAIQWQA